MKTNVCLSFLLAVMVMVSCSPSREKQIAKIDALEQTALKDYDTVQWKKLSDLYARFVKDFPTDSLSPEFLFDQANLFRVMKKGPEAMGALSTLIDRYPDHSRVPECYFLRGLVYEEVYYEPAMAKQAYLRFVNLYPEHPLVRTAEYSIQFLGMSPEEIVESFADEEEVEGSGLQKAENTGSAEPVLRKKEN